MSDKINIWTDEEQDKGKAAVPRMAQVTRHVVSASADVISDNLAAFLKAFEPITTQAADATSAFEIDEIELSLVVNGKGGIELVGKLEAGAEASIKIKLKRKSASEKDA